MLSKQTDIQASLNSQHNIPTCQTLLNESDDTSFLLTLRLIVADEGPSETKDGMLKENRKPFVMIKTLAKSRLDDISYRKIVLREYCW